MKHCRAWMGVLIALFMLAEARSADAASPVKVSSYPAKLLEVAACVGALARSPRPVSKIEEVTVSTTAEYWQSVKAGKVLVGVSFIPLLGPFRMLDEPFAFRDPAHFKSFKDNRLFRAMAADQAKRDGIFPLAVAYAGQRALLSKKQISGPEDFKGLRVRSFPGKAFSALGAKLFSSPLGELKPALDRSVVDAAEILPAWIRLFQLSESAKNLYLTGFVTDMVLFSVQSKAWSALPPERRKELAGWFSEAADACSRANYDAESRALKELESKGVRVFPFDAAGARAKIPVPKGGPGWTAQMWNELQSLK